MSKLKRIPAPGWFVAGLVVAALLIPATAGAGAVLTYTGIEGRGGTRANVTEAGQLESVQAGASQLFVDTVPSSSEGLASVDPPPGKALIITSLQVETFQLVTGAGMPYFALDVFEANYGTVAVGTVAAPTPGTTVLPFDPGMAIPSGDYFSFIASGLSGEITVVGYTVPATDVASSDTPVQPPPPILPHP